MRDGIYKVALEADGLKGMMVGAMRNGRLTGCDQSHFVTGTFKRNGHRINGSFRMTRHTRHPNIREIANLDEFNVNFSGICGESFGQFEAKVPERPGLVVYATFRWVCDA